MKSVRCTVLAAMVMLGLLTPEVRAQLVLPWYSIDGGGGMFSAGGTLSLRGTIGQPDAGMMTGGGLTIRGGFWAGVAASGTGAPAATLQSAVSTKTHGSGVGEQTVAINPAGQVQNDDLSTEPRAGGLSELSLTFDVAPGTPGANPVRIEEQACPGGTQADYTPYTGSSVVGASVAGEKLVLTFSPGLENARTYKLTLGPEVSSIPDQAIEVRVLKADVNGEGHVNALDRAVLIGVWTGAAGYSVNTDINLSGRTDALDRAALIGAWTGSQNCAP